MSIARRGTIKWVHESLIEAVVKWALMIFNGVDDYREGNEIGKANRDFLY